MRTPVDCAASGETRIREAGDEQRGTASAGETKDTGTDVGHGQHLGEGV